MPDGFRSAKIRWFSVPPETSVYPLLIIAFASAWQLVSTCMQRNQMQSVWWQLVSTCMQRNQMQSVWWQLVSTCMQRNQMHSVWRVLLVREQLGEPFGAIRCT